MSTRANIILKDKYDTLWFYRHSDGYPDGAMPTLNKFLSLVKDGKIRNNVSQSAGWLIMLGAIEYQTVAKSAFPIKGSKYDAKNREKIDATINEAMKNFIPKDWKVGAIEPTTGQHGHIAYLYTIDLEKQTIKCKKV